LATLEPDNPTGSGNLVIWGLESGCREILRNIEGLRSPMWSPTSPQIAFTFRFDLYILDLQAARDAGWMQLVCDS
jgi:hypothetical protein